MKQKGFEMAIYNSIFCLFLLSLTGDSKANCWHIITGSHAPTDFWAMYCTILGSEGTENCHESDPKIQTL